MDTHSQIQSTGEAHPAQHSFGRELRVLGAVLLAAGELVGCRPAPVAPAPDPTPINAEEFRTNFFAHAGSTVRFEAFYTVEVVGTNSNRGNPYPIYRYDFFADRECSLALGTTTLHFSTTRDKVLLTVPIDRVHGQAAAVQWNRIAVDGIDDASRPANGNAVDRYVRQGLEVNPQNGGQIYSDVPIR